MLISEKAARRFERFFRQNEFLFGGTQVHLRFCKEPDPLDPYEGIIEKNSVKLANFSLNKETKSNLEDYHNRCPNAIDEPPEYGRVILYKPFGKPDDKEGLNAEMALRAFLFGAKCREAGSSKKV